MDANDLLRLHSSSKLTLGQLKASDPTLYAKIAAMAPRTPANQAAPGWLPSPLSDDLRVGDLHFAQTSLNAARMQVIASLAKVHSELPSLSTKLASPSAVSNATLSALVAAGNLSAPEATALGCMTNLFVLSGENQALLASLRDTPLASGPVTSIRQLAALDAGAWLGLFRDRKIAPTTGSIDSDAAVLAARLGAADPDAALFGRLPTLSPKTISVDLDALAPLFALNAIVVGPGFDTLNTTGVLPDLLSGLRARQIELTQYANAWAGLGLAALLNDKTTGSGARADEAARRVGLMNTVVSGRPELALLHLDFSPDAADVTRLNLPGLGIAAADQDRVVKTLAACQRAHALVGNVDDALTLLVAGISSATAAATLPYADFAKRTGWVDAKARGVWQDAQRMHGTVTATAGSVLDHWRGGFRWLNVNNADPAIDDVLNKLDGFADLFGNQAYCKCDECASVLGAAAYFVDLMAYVQKNIRDRFFATPNHPLDLKTRRPDLWKLELTCDNTNNLVPTLQIANGILESGIAASAGANLGDPVAVEKAVYQDTLATAARSFLQPFYLPLERLTTYLSFFSRTPGTLARTLGAPAATITSAELGLSPKEYEIVTNKNTSLAALQGFYTVGFPIMGGTIGLLDAQTLLSPMGVTRAELGALVATRFVNTGLSHPVAIQPGQSDPQSVQNDIEHVAGLTVDALDALQRFTRVWKKTGWGVGELDLVLAEIGDTTLKPSALDAVVAVRQISGAVGTSVEETCALFGDLPAFPVTTGAVSFVDRTFNPPAFVAQGKLPDAARTFLHPALRTTSSPPDPLLPRLLAGLRVSSDDLLRVITFLAKPLGADLASNNEAARAFALSASNLALLYRHARLAQRLQLSVAALFQLIGFVPALNGRVASLEDLQTLLDANAWISTSGYSLDDIGIATGGTVLDATKYKNPALVASQIISDVGSANALVFADTVFAAALGITESASRSILAANPPRFSTAPDGAGLWLAVGDDPSVPLTIPAGVPATASAAAGVLASYRAATVVPRRLAAILGIAVDKMASLLAMTGLPLVGAPIDEALRGGSPQALVSLVRAVIPLSVAFQSGAFDAAALARVQGAPQPLGIVDTRHLRPADLRALSTYARYAPAPTATPFSTDATPVDPLDVWQALAAFQSGAGFPPAMDAVLGRVLHTTAGMITTLRGQLPPPADAASALDRLGQCVALAQYLGVSGEALLATASQDYGALQTAADATLGAFRAKFTDESARDAALAPYDDKLRSRKRDGLTNYFIFSANLGFKTQGDLYEYFLIDVELGGCARTSRVVSAASSVQLYVYRVLMNLEQDAQGFIVTLEGDAAAEWSWRQNYRVWQANREVFLFPENYLVPDIRDNKTPLFRELESTLLQQEINEQNVLDAYSSYMEGFQEIAGLTIAGVYHHVPPAKGPGPSASDVLHVFGATAADPPAYYYRTATNLLRGERDPAYPASYSPWEKVELKIPGRRVAPVVYNGRLHVFWFEISSQPQMLIQGGSGTCTGYRHTFRLKFSSLRLDGSWTPPQEITLSNFYPFDQASGVVADPFVGSTPTPRLSRVPQTNPPIEGYTLSGPNWDAPIMELRSSGALGFSGCEFTYSPDVDLFRRRLPNEASSVLETGGNPLWAVVPLMASKLDTLPPATKPTYNLYAGFPTNTYAISDNTYGAFTIDKSRVHQFYADNLPGWEDVFGLETDDHYMWPLAILNDNAGLLNVSGSFQNIIVQTGSDPVFLQGVTTWRPIALRLGTTLAETVAKLLFSSGVSGLLGLSTQQALREDPLPFQIQQSVLFGAPAIQDRSNAGTLDFKGALGVYYQEIFFHIPLLIATHLQSQQRFAAAQSWYEHIFNPTALESPAPTPPTDRVWRYLQFRGLGVPRLRDTLTDPAALQAYATDPWNPYAIARLRLSGFQKNVVMSYVGNLLDWADNLFTQFTTESVNEATMLYRMASDILGPRPPALGDCGDGPVKPKTYENIAALIGSTPGLLVSLETYAVGKWNAAKAASSSPSGGTYAIPPDIVGAAMQIPAAAAVPVTDGAPAAEAGLASDAWKGTGTAGWAAKGAAATGKNRVGTLSRSIQSALALHQPASFAGGLLAQLGPVFCVPPNQQLLGLWDRVEDRLFKIHHCMNIAGATGQPPLFGPPIDPRLLVQLKAEGISLDDILAVTSGNLPPYRFLYLIEKAKSFAGVVQGFGAALLSTLEKKDNERLNQLRVVQQQNIAQMTTQLRQWEIDVANETLAALTTQQSAATDRVTYYDGLIANGLNPQETAQEDAQKSVPLLLDISAIHSFYASIGFAIPQFGAPTALTYGGSQIGGIISAVGASFSSLAGRQGAVASSHAMEAGFARRAETWTFQRDQAKQEVAQLGQQIKAATVRVNIATSALAIHQASVTQLEDMYAFFSDKLTNLGLYGWLATTLQRTYRGAYTSALALAQLAQQAFRYERPGDLSVNIAPSYWDAPHTGLLAGEQLVLDLLALERRFMETNYRTLEVDQAFTLSQIDPAALVTLRETGECHFAIPEVFFDLAYPGQYQRRIKAVRVSIPCITGPYTNVSATLTLEQNAVRNEPKLGPMFLVEQPIQRTSTIATSTAQNDAGVFELSFRDERYMPFEGAGAISGWGLVLPKAFRQFDYESITDVVLSVSYQALRDGAFRQEVEANNASAEGSILQYLATHSVGRVVSLRHELAAAFNALVHNPVGTAVSFEIPHTLFPVFARAAGHSVTVVGARLALKTAAGVAVTGFGIALDGVALTTFAPDPTLGGLLAQDAGAVFATAAIGTHTIAVSAAGSLALANASGTDASALDDRKLIDVLLYLQYRVT